MSKFLIHNPDGFNDGYTPITTLDEKKNGTGMNFGILKLKANQKKDLTSDLESAYLLMQGHATFYYDDKEYNAQRSSFFEEDPIAIHLSASAKAHIQTHSDCEFAVSQTENAKHFATEIFDHNNMLESERRGKGLLNDTAYRIVRTLFDDRNRPEANLVLGEVITFPGRWSSYPPHHHPQPEIYHYRFTEPRGFGHSELGDDVLKIKQYDTIKILDEKTHPQVSAPGYGMYYIWVIRHLADARYSVPTFIDTHNWTRTEEANTRVWQPKT